MNVNLEDSGAGVHEYGDAEAPDAVIAEINITPLTDVFLVLLIIFMVTTTAVVDAEKAARDGVKVALPKADAAGPVTQKRAVPILTITKTGELYLFSRKLDSANLEAGAAQGAGRRPVRDAAAAGRSTGHAGIGGERHVHRQARRRQEHRDPDRAGQVAAGERRPPPLTTRTVARTITPPSLPPTRWRSWPPPTPLIDTSCSRVVRSARKNSEMPRNPASSPRAHRALLEFQPGAQHGSVADSALAGIGEEVVAQTVKECAPSSSIDMIRQPLPSGTARRHRPRRRARRSQNRRGSTTAVAPTSAGPAQKRPEMSTPTP